MNSELLDLWYAVRGKAPRDVWRNYEPQRMNELPYRRPDGDPRAEDIAALVREIAANRTALLSHRAVVRDLGRTVKDPWRTGPIEIDRPALVRELPASETVSVRVDPDLAVVGSPAGRPHRADSDTLAFRRGREETGRVTGDPGRLDLLEEMIGRTAESVSSIVLPKDLAAFAAESAARVARVSHLLADGRRQVERVERLVCALYGLPDELTDAVVEHAVERARRSTPAD